MNEHIYQTNIHSTDELNQRLIYTRCNLDQEIIATAIVTTTGFDSS